MLSVRTSESYLVPRERNLFLRSARLAIGISNVVAHSRTPDSLVVRKHNVKVQHADRVITISALLAHVGTVPSFVTRAAQVAKHTLVALALPDGVAVLVVPLAASVVFVRGKIL